MNKIKHVEKIFFYILQLKYKNLGSKPGGRCVCNYNKTITLIKYNVFF